MEEASHQSKVAHSQNSSKGRGPADRPEGVETETSGVKDGKGEKQLTRQRQLMNNLGSWTVGIRRGLWAWREPQLVALGIWEWEDLTFLAKITLTQRQFMGCASEARPLRLKTAG